MEVKVFDGSIRDKKCPHESSEHMAFVNWLRKNHPNYHGLLIHPKNEGVRTHSQVARDRAIGSLNKGASDLIILGKVPFVCELKRQDRTLSKLLEDQKVFLNQAVESGCYACVAYGAKQAIAAFEDWLNATG